MRTFLAFRFNDEITENEIIKKSNALKDYYQKSYLKYDLSMNYSYLVNCGSIIIDDENAPLNFPDKIVKDKNEIINFFPPLEVSNHEESNANGIIKLCKKLENNENEVADLSSTFLFSVLNKEKKEMVIYNDALGLNRLYILETEKGVFWSNRPSALLIFSNTKAEIDLESWKIYAAAGWFINDRSPFKNIKRVKPGMLYKTNIHDSKLYEIAETNSIQKLIELTKDKAASYREIADQMTKELEAFNKLWKVKPQIDISGGNDSRVAAATVIHSNIDNYTFRSIEDIDEEVLTAKLLLDKANVNKNIKVLNPLEYINNQEPLVDRIMKILFEFDGDFATVMVNSPIIEDNQFESIDKTLVFGFGGEVSKGAFYSNQRWLDKLNKLGEEAGFYRLSTHFSKVGCVSKDSLDLMNIEIKNVLNLAKAHDITNLKELDFFHFYERFRRWTPIGDKANSFSPFLNKHFISLGLNNDPQDNMEIKVHKNLIYEMQPEWNEVPFFKATSEQSQEKDIKNLRLWQTSDKLAIEKILEQAKSWNDVFIEDDVISLWKQAQEEGIPNFRETLFQRVALRSLFNNHIDIINDYIEKSFGKL